jgi:DNA-binding CsgD family transcriptional regulator
VIPLPLAPSGPPISVVDQRREIREVVMADGRRYRLVPVGEELPTSRPPLPAAALLTERELQIVTLVAEGLVNKEIGVKLSISEWTVSTHLRRIFAKLGVDRRAAMVSKCLTARAVTDSP